MSCSQRSRETLTSSATDSAPADVQIKTKHYSCVCVGKLKREVTNRQKKKEVKPTLKSGRVNKLARRTGPD